jgi:hypothetical protein
MLVPQSIVILPMAKISGIVATGFSFSSNSEPQSMTLKNHDKNFGDGEIPRNLSVVPGFRMNRPVGV